MFQIIFFNDDPEGIGSLIMFFASIEKPAPVKRMG
jgi:hypothetical protein